MHLIGLITKKFVTMHGHMNVKFVLFSIVDTSEVGIKFKEWGSKAADDKVLPSKYSNAIH